MKATNENKATPETSALDGHLHHAFTCPHKPGIIQRHKLVRNATEAILKAAASLSPNPAAMEITSEPNVLRYMPKTLIEDVTPELMTKRQRMRGDLHIKIRNLTGTQLHFLLDIVVTHPLPTIDPAPATASAKREETKFNHYGTHFGKKIKEHVHPIAVETYGRLGNKAKASITTILRLLNATAHTRYVYERIAIALARGNTCVMSKYIINQFETTERPLWLVNSPNYYVRQLMSVEVGDEN